MHVRVLVWGHVIEVWSFGDLAIIDVETARSRCTINASAAIQVNDLRASSATAAAEDNPTPPSGF